MRIVTVNLPDEIVEEIEVMLKSPDSSYPSRAELARAALREFLLDELKFVQKKEAQAKNEKDPTVPYDPIILRRLE